MHSCCGLALGCVFVWEILHTKNSTQFYGNLIQTVETTHLYAEESFQMTTECFTSSEMLHYRLNGSSTALDFAGNTQQLHLQASIPQLSLIVSFDGVALILATAIGVAVLRKRTSNAIEHAVDVEVVADAMFNKAKYPSAFLTTTLREVLANTSPAEQEVLLDTLHVQHIELVRTEEVHSHDTLVNSSPKMTLV